MTDMDTSTTRLSRLASRTVLITSLITLGSMFGPTPAQASPERVTRGGAQAVLNAFGSGGFVIRHREGIGIGEGVVHGAPADSELRASIRPASDSPWDGRHFCAEDWHVILLGDFEGGDKSFTVQDARVIMDQIGMEFFLDGAPLATERTAIKRFTVPEFFGFEKVYYFNQGAILSPSALTVGSHTVKIVATGPFAGTDQITIFIDAPGTGTCL